MTAAIVVEIFLSPEPLSKLLKTVSFGLGRGFEIALRLGIDPPRAFLVFLRYCISGESSAGLTYGRSSISESLTGILNLSLKDLILSSESFFTW